MRPDRDQPPQDEAPECLLCGSRSIEILDDAYLLLRGAFMESTDLGTVVFKLDPDTDMQVVQLADGSLALVTTQGVRSPTRSAHAECLHTLAYDVGASPIDPEDEERMQDDIPMEFR